MAWRVELLKSAERDLDRLDSKQASRIQVFLYERLEKLDDPRSIGQALRGERFGEFWKYRVGDYRIIAKIEDQRLLVLVVGIGHRREVYR
jgi:mRNA interferase RelE/StbE